MKTIKGVKSQSKPIEIDDYSSPTTVFVRVNIQELDEVDPVFKTTRKVFTYDEIQYTYPEWNKLITDNIRVKGEAIQEQVDITQLAMSEILNMIGTLMCCIEDPENNTIPNTMTMNKMVRTMNNIALDTNFSAIAKMYAGMINRKLITIDSVTDIFKDEVLSYLEYLKENKE